MVKIGINTSTGRPVTLSAEARSRGTYVIGATGTGKTTLLQSVAYQDMANGHGVCVIDPHGDMTEYLLDRVPPEREADVVLFEPGEEDHPLGLNLLDCDRENPKQVRWVVSTIVGTLRRLYEWSWGPRLEHVLTHTLWTAMKIPGSTMLEVLLLLTDQAYRQQWTKQLQEPLLVNFWKTFPTAGNQREQERLLDFISSTVNKLTPFLLDETMRAIVGQSESAFKIRELINDRKILLVNLSKGDIGETNSGLLGSVLVNLILMAALSRKDMAPEERQARPFHLIVDEYQNFASESFSVLQSEARKYAVTLMVAHQYRDQLTESLKGSALNVGNFIAFRTTGLDGLELARQFDNTPEEPEEEPRRIFHLTDRRNDIYQADKSRYKMVPGARRPFSDVAQEKANNLSNLPPFRALVRLIDHDEGRQLQLIEHELITADPRQAGSASFYGRARPGQAARIRAANVKDRPARAEVLAEIDTRTFGRTHTRQPGLLSPEAVIFEAGEAAHLFPD